MAPTMILFGLVFGWWWRSTLIVAAVVWPALVLVSSHGETGLRVILAAALIGFLNAVVGVLIAQGVLHLVRMMRDREPAP